LVSDCARAPVARVGIEKVRQLLAGEPSGGHAANEYGARAIGAERLGIGSRACTLSFRRRNGYASPKRDKVQENALFWLKVLDRWFRTLSFSFERVLR